MRTDVVVIGAGFWGSAVSDRLQQQLGWQVTLLDARLPEAASKAAAGLVRESSLERPNAPWWGPEHRLACREYVEHWGGLPGEEWMISSAERPARRRGGLWQLWPASLMRPALEQVVHRLQADSGEWLTHTDTEVWSSRRLVLTAGAQTDALLAASGLRTCGLLGLQGSALVGKASKPLELPHTLGYRLAGDTRTRTLTARCWGDLQLRVGDTCGELESEQWRVLRGWFQKMGGEEPSQRVWGVRPKRVQGMLVEEWAPGLVVASGGERTGLASAAGVALRVCQLLTSRRD